MTQFKKPALLLTLGAAIALIAGGTAAYWWLTQRRTPTEALPVGGNLIPDEALVTLSFSTDKGEWRQLRTFGTVETQTILNQNLAQFRDRLLTANGYDYENDVQPWVGEEITVAFLPPPTQGSDASTSLPDVSEPESSPTAEPNAELEESAAASESAADEETPEDDAAPEAIPPAVIPDPEAPQSLVVVVPIDDPAAAQRSLGAQAASARSERTYEGLEVREFQGDSGETYFTTVINNRFLVLTTTEPAIDQVIDTFKGEAAVVDAPGYRQAFRQVSADQPFLRVYVNVPAASAVAAERSINPDAQRNLTLFQSSQGVAATLTLESDGLRLQGITWLDPDSERQYKVANTASRMPDLLPESTLAMVSGGNLQTLWEDYSQSSETSAPTPFNADNMRVALETLTGLEVDQNFMPWMEGEFALALISAGASESSASDAPASGPTEDIGVLLLVQASDRPAAEKNLAQLDKAVSDRYGFQVNETEVEGRPVVNWVSRFQALNMTRGWLDGNVAFLAIGSDAAKTILAQPGQTLAENALFREATSSVLEPHNGHFFVNFERLLNIRSPLPLPTLPSQQESVLGAVQAIGVTTAVNDVRSLRYDISVLLQAMEDPGTLPPPDTDRGEAEPSPDSPEPNSLEPSANPLLEAEPLNPDSAPDPMPKASPDEASATPAN